MPQALPSSQSFSVSIPDKLSEALKDASAARKLAYLQAWDNACKSPGAPASAGSISTLLKVMLFSATTPNDSQLESARRLQGKSRADGRNEWDRFLFKAIRGQSSEQMSRSHFDRSLTIHFPHFILLQRHCGTPSRLPGSFMAIRSWNRCISFAHIQFSGQTRQKELTI